MRFFFVLFVLFLFGISFCSASRIVLGQVEDALDGESANGHVVVLWNVDNGMSDNLTDVIGVTGNSGVDNNFSFDCENLITPCKVNDELRLRVFNEGDNYVSEEVGMVVGGGDNIVGTFRLNSPPSVSLVYPDDNSNVSSVFLNCSVSDLDGNLERVDLYGNWTGVWSLNESRSVLGSSEVVSFFKSLSEGFYDWSCVVYDSLNISDVLSENFSFGVDYSVPVINSVFVNESYVCGSGNVRVSCNTSDNFGISKVIIEAVNSTSSENYSGVFSSGVYYADVFVDDIFNWNFTCYSYDFAENFNSESVFMNVFSFAPDLRVAFSGINFSNLFPVEGEEVEVSAVIENGGCIDASDVLVGFYEGSVSGDNFANKSVFVSGLSNASVSALWSSVVGLSDIFIFADLDESFSEFNEGDNIADRIFEVSSWQNFYGNISAIKLLSDFFVNDILSWNSSFITGNVFIADSESDVDWLSLVGIGRNSSGDVFLDDFSEVDSLLGMNGFYDSVENVYAQGGVPRYIENFSIHNFSVLNVPVINTSESFSTGVLWDASDDNNGEYDSVEKEDLVFVSFINQSSAGAYGVYDFEIKIPVLLRSYEDADSSEVYFYYEIE